MKKIIALVAVVAMVAAFSMSIFGKKLPSIGYVLVGPHTDGGWSMRHHQGFQSLTKHGYKVGISMVVCKEFEHHHTENNLLNTFVPCA